MATKNKLSRQRQGALKDKEEMRKFLTIVVIATLLLILLMYFILV
jgi:hypothetical protein